MNGTTGRLLPGVLAAALAACVPAEEQARPAKLLSGHLATESQAQDAVSEPVPAVDLEPEPRPEVDAYGYPEWNGYDLDCPDVGRMVRVSGDDPHGLDRDGDGWGCESYRG